MKILHLNDGWRLHEAPLEWGPDQLPRAMGLPDGWYGCDLPADVRMPLIEAGVIRDPVVGDACFETEWIEKRSWWFVKTFSADQPGDGCGIAELVLDKLDTLCYIFLNGQLLGRHASVHYPFVRDVKGLLRQGENTLAVRVTAGLEEIADTQVAELRYAVCTERDNGREGRGDMRRAFVRRPQYTVGWDWGPRIVTCGIAGQAMIRFYPNITIREVNLVTLAADTTAKLRAEINVELLDMVSSVSGSVHITLSRSGQVCAQAQAAGVLFTSGYNYVTFTLDVADAQLWWPAGSGAQPLYTVAVTADSGGARTSFPAFQYGIRTVALDQSVIAGEERRFELIVNGTRIFSKGGNWVPADMIHARVGEAKIRRLLTEAAAANFNALRVWGGGLYEQDCFYEICDELGILLFHDFMLACAAYPDHCQDFVGLVRSEMDYQTKRLRNHPCMALYFGSNENHWLFNHVDHPHRGITFTHAKPYGLALTNLLAKEVIHSNCPAIPYWNSSPYGGERPNSDTVGDVHRWQNAFMSKDMAERIEVKDYDGIRSKFISEYGYVGPCRLETTKRYLGLEDTVGQAGVVGQAATGRQANVVGQTAMVGQAGVVEQTAMVGQTAIDRGSKLWELHNNVFEKGTVAAGIYKNYHLDAAQMDMETYILYGGMVHGLMFGYSLEAYRFKDFCGGGLIWMYNDAYGEQGWTIVDYYARRKIPFYAVKRALAHTKLTMRARDGAVTVQGLNDTADEVTCQAEFGYVSFDGKVRDTRMVELCLPARSRVYLFTEPLPAGDYTKGSVMLIPAAKGLEPIWLRTDDMWRMAFDPAQVRVTGQRRDGEDLVADLYSDRFAHGVHVKGDYDCSDNYFDLLPGEIRQVRVKGIGERAVEVGVVR